MQSEIIIHNLDELPKAAKTILNAYDKRRVFTFSGEMGAGKTTLIKALCTELGIQEQVSSPTFAIVNEYHSEATIFHIDLYRLNNLQEALDIGIEEYLSAENYCFIEWPDLIKNLLPEQTVTISIREGPNQVRILNISSAL